MIEVFWGTSSSVIAWKIVLGSRGLSLGYLLPVAVCFFCPESKGVQDEKSHAGDLAKVLRDAKQEVPAEFAQRFSWTQNG